MARARPHGTYVSPPTHPPTLPPSLSPLTSRCSYNPSIYQMNHSPTHSPIQVGRESILEQEDAPTDIFLVPGLRKHQKRAAYLLASGKTPKRKAAVQAAKVEEEEEEEVVEEEEELVDTPVKGKRGRKVGSRNGPKKEKVVGGEEATAVPKKRGRKPKVKVEEE